MLDVKNVSKTFAKGTVNEHIALEKINLHLDRGEFLTIVGSNGAGKSTLFNLICGTFMQDSGTVTLDGQDISFLPEHRRAKLIGRVFQDPMKGTAPNMTIEENLALAYTRAHSSGLALALSKKKSNFFREQVSRFNMGLEDRMKPRSVCCPAAAASGHLADVHHLHPQAAALRRTHRCAGSGYRQKGDGHYQRDRGRKQHHHHDDHPQYVLCTGHRRPHHYDGQRPNHH